MVNESFIFIFAIAHGSGSGGLLNDVESAISGMSGGMPSNIGQAAAGLSMLKSADADIGLKLFPIYIFGLP